MNSSELFAAMPESVATEILEYHFTNDKPMYRVALEAVAQARKVRGIFLERQPRTQRNATMISMLGRPGLLQASNNLVSSWLLKKHTAVLIDFLDALKIPHEKGVVEDLPKTVEDASLHAAVDALLAKYPAEVVIVYLHAFDNMNEANWPNLESMLANDERLKFKAAA